MSEHSLKELKRQRDNAKLLMEQAKTSLSAAEKRYHDCLCRESGLMNKVAINKRNRILVQDIKFLRGGEPFWVTGFKMKNDGTPGMQQVGCDVESCEFEDYTPPPRYNPTQKEK